jgi:hypothetical protein
VGDEMSEEQSYSSYEERILAAALKLAESPDDPNASSEAVSEIVLCARGILRRAPRDPDDDIEERRRSITRVDVPRVPAPLESHVEYDDGPIRRPDDGGQGGER